MSQVKKESEHPTIRSGDDDKNHDPSSGEEEYDATWGEVYETCCVHTSQEWGMIALGLLGVIFFLYFFLFSIELLGAAAKVLTGCSAGELFGDDMNPIAGVMIGLLCTALIQSSSTTTSITVSLVGSAISIKQGIYIIMGANIGTTVTNTIVSIGQIGSGDQLERAFAAATVHDMFNYLTVAVLLPVEAATGYLFHLTKALVKNANTKDGESWEGPLDKIVAPLANKVIEANSGLIRAVAKGTGSCEDGGGYYPTMCEPGEPTKETCNQTGLIRCNSDTNECPAFFQVGATAKDDQVSGGVCFFLAIVLLFVCLVGLCSILQRMLLSMSTRIIYKATDVNGYIAILIGCGVTVLVQSSSITTSALTPIAGIGALRLEQMYPLTLGANIGTTVTALMAAMVTEGTGSLQVALAHLFFNLTGIVIYYPIPFMRNIPMNAARKLGKATRIWRGFPFVYIGVMFFLLPAILLGISYLFEEDSKGYTVLGSFLVILIVVGAAYFVYYWRYQNGREICIARMQRRERRRVVMEELPDDMDYLKAKVAAIAAHTGLADDEVKDVDGTKKPLVSSPEVSDEDDELDA